MNRSRIAILAAVLSALMLAMSPAYAAEQAANLQLKPCTIELVDGATVEGQLAVQSEMDDHLIVCSPRLATLRSFLKNHVHALNVDGKRKQLNAKRAMTAEDKQLLGQVEWLDEPPAKGFKPAYTTEAWDPPERLLVWAKPGRSGRFGTQSNWRSNGKPVKVFDETDIWSGPYWGRSRGVTALDKETDLLTPAAASDYQVRGRGSYIARHITVESGASLSHGLEVSAGLPRVVILTDIGGDPDDQQSLVRLLVYSNELEIDGIACSPFSTSVENSMNIAKEIIDAYGQVRSNLALHASGYPSASALESLVKGGQTGLKWTGRGGHEDYWEFIGAGKDTEASELIYELLTDDDPRPVWFLVWGGPVNLAQALWKLTQTHSADDVEAIKETKVRVHDIYTQDCTVQYVKDFHSDLFYIEDNKVFRGMMRGAEDDESLIDGAWSDAHVRLGHGPLGDLYPSRGGRGVKEGDTPTFLYLLPNGLLGDFEQPTWGSWGGRFQSASTGSHWFADTEDRSYGDARVAQREETIYRWREEFQNDFAARMDWCVKAAGAANHNPVAAFDGDASRDAVLLAATSGSTVALSAAGSSDPDGDGLSYEWLSYPEPGTFGGSVAIANANQANASFTAPGVTEPKTVHIVLRVRDDGTPALFSYKRIVVTVSPGDGTSGGGREDGPRK